MKQEVETPRRAGGPPPRSSLEDDKKRGGQSKDTPCLFSRLCRVLLFSVAHQKANKKEHKKANRARGRSPPLDRGAPRNKSNRNRHLMIHSWPSWVLAAAAAIAVSRIASGGVGLFDGTIGFFFPSAKQQRSHGLPPLRPLAASFLLIVLGIGIGAASVVAGMVRWRSFESLRCFVRVFFYSSERRNNVASVVVGVGVRRGRFFSPTLSESLKKRNGTERNRCTSSFS